MADYRAQALERERKAQRLFVTPEGVDLNLRLADRGRRVSAFLLDGLITIGSLIAVTLLALFGGFSFDSQVGGQIIGIIWLIGFFLLRNGYFILMEMGPRAATWGKRANGLRVVSRSGGRLTADAVIARNLMREIEFFLPLIFLLVGAADGSVDGWIALLGLGWTGIFLFFPWFNKDRLRVGDLLAGTWVIMAPRRKLGTDLVPGGPGRAQPDFTDEQLDVYGAYELQTLEQVLRRAEPAAMATVAHTIREKIGYVQQGSDEAFLTAYYEALRARLERNMLFGRRRQDKHDR